MKTGNKASTSTNKAVGGNNKTKILANYKAMVAAGASMARGKSMSIKGVMKGKEKDDKNGMC